jgi:hypothetical protein
MGMPEWMGVWFQLKLGGAQMNGARYQSVQIR